MGFHQSETSRIQEGLQSEVRKGLAEICTIIIANYICIIMTTIYKCSQIPFQYFSSFLKSLLLCQPSPDLPATLFPLPLFPNTFQRIYRSGPTPGSRGMKNAGLGNGMHLSSQPFAFPSIYLD